jgi:hypothetical protein
VKVRRVVTGHRAGKATFVSDEAVQATTVALLPGSETHRLWGADRAPTFPEEGGARMDTPAVGMPVRIAIPQTTQRMEMRYDRALPAAFHAVTATAHQA